MKITDGFSKRTGLQDREDVRENVHAVDIIIIFIACKSIEDVKFNNEQIAGSVSRGRCVIGWAVVYLFNDPFTLYNYYSHKTLSRF